MTDFHKKSIQSLLSEKRLAEAFAELRQTAQTLQNWQLNNRLDELEESYKYMIRYVADGCNDPQREEIHNGITAKLMELADITGQELTVQNSPKLYYETLRMERKYPQKSGGAARSIPRMRRQDSIVLRAAGRQTRQ